MQCMKRSNHADDTSCICLVIICTYKLLSPMCGLSEVTSYTKIIDAVNLLYSCSLLIISIQAMHMKVEQVPRSRR